MTSAIQGVGNSGSMMSFGNQASLTETQKKTLQEIIAKYDMENMTDSDFESLVSDLKEAGIRPSAEVDSILEETGLNIEDFMKESPPPPPMSGAGGMGKPKDMEEGLEELLKISEETEDTELQTLVEELLAKYEDGTVTEEDHQELMSYLQENAPQLGFFMDVKA